MNLYNYVAGAPFPPGMPNDFNQWKFGRVDVVIFALAVNQDEHFASNLAHRLQTDVQFRGLVYSLGPENRDYLKCADFFHVPAFPAYIVVSYRDFRTFFCAESATRSQTEEDERFWRYGNHNTLQPRSSSFPEIDPLRNSHKKRIDYAIINADVLERSGFMNNEEEILKLAQDFYRGKTLTKSPSLIVRSISARQLEELRYSAQPLQHDTEILVLFSRPAWRHIELEHILYEAFISFGAQTDSTLVRILYPSYISDEYATYRAKYQVVKLPAAIFCLGQTGQLVVKVERDFFESIQNLRERVPFLIADIHHAIVSGHLDPTQDLTDTFSSTALREKIAIEKSEVATGPHTLALRPARTMSIHRVIGNVAFEASPHQRYPAQIDEGGKKSRDEFSYGGRAMEPEIFLEQKDIPLLVKSLNRFAMKTNAASDRLDVLMNAGIEASFISDLKLDSKANAFSNALVAKFRDFRASDRTPKYHPLVQLLEYLLETQELDEQESNFFRKLVQQGQENLNALTALSGVGRIESPLETPIGTGIFLGNRLLLTCAHILGRNGTQQAWVRFGYKVGRYGRESGEVCELEPELVSSPSRLDFVLMKIKNTPKQQAAILVPNRLDAGQEVRLIHHPQGQPIQVSGTGHIVQVGEDYIDHDIRADHGSSGAPIYDKDWHFIAIHRGHPGLGRPVIAGTTEGLPLYAIWDKISPHISLAE